MSFIKSLMVERAPKITPEKTLEILRDNPEVKFIDVRTRQEYEHLNIPHSINIPIEEFIGIEDRILDKNTVIIVFSQNGGRSAKAGSILLSKGYKKVKDMGSIENWPYNVNNGWKKPLYGITWILYRGFWMI